MRTGSNAGAVARQASALLNKGSLNKDGVLILLVNKYDEEPNAVTLVPWREAKTTTLVGLFVAYLSPNGRTRSGIVGLACIVSLA